MNTAGRRTEQPEVWGGIECTVNRVGDRWFDQIRRCGHHDRLADLQQCAALGIKGLRYPLLWERLAPVSLNDIDWRWADERMAALRDLGLRPIVGLVHHGSGPGYTSLLDDGFPVGLARLAGAVAERYPWVTDYIPVNEPLTTARFSGLYGHWYPHHRSERSYVRALLNQLKAVVLAMRSIRRITPSARLIQTEDCGRILGTPALRAQVEHETARQWLTWDLLTGRMDETHPLRDFLVGAGMTANDEAFFAEAECPPDVLGLNYYLTSDRFLDDRLDRHPAHTHGSNGVLHYADVEAVRGCATGIAGHEAHLLSAWQRYRIPVAITEVHLACSREEQLRWLGESWQGALAAQRRGADVRAITAWALFGSYDWNCLVTEDRGRYEPGVFDVRGPAPRATALAQLVTDLAAGRSRTGDPILAKSGWWRHVQSSAGARSSRSAKGAARPIAILGSTGTLGQAFHRICATRGLSSVLIGRQDCNITDSAEVHALLDQVRPWAVINATGYVRVDDAELDAETCRRVNVLGALHIATACAERDIPFVTFSSDLVFDGRQERPYLEEDLTNPLNVYGATKAEAERLVLALQSEALVIRTSAFFGPWDAHNFAANLVQVLGAGRAISASGDTTVSPTYVPDLVHATLDLLIDREQGLWHLANDGQLSWFDFAHMLAERCDLPKALIRRAEGVLSQHAPRPRFSALGTSRGQVLPTLETAVDQWHREISVSRPSEWCLS